MEKDVVYKGYRMLMDWHTHTVYSHGMIYPHGKGTIEENVEAARQRGLKEIAISDHGPAHLTYGIKKSKIPEMRKKIDLLNEKYNDIKVRLSVEANIINTENFLDISKEEFKDFDFIIAGYHYGVFNGYCINNYIHDSTKKIRKNKKNKNNLKLMIKNTEMAVKCIYENDLKILTHPGDKAPFDMKELIKACEVNNTYMEISTWHHHMTVEELKMAKQSAVQFVISSDAHHPKRVGDFKGGLDRAIESGIDLCRIVNIEKV